MVKKESKTVQLGLRIDKEILKRIEELAKMEDVDKMSWIRRALAASIGDAETDLEDIAIEDYIKGRIDEKDLLNQTGMNIVPQDLKEARKEVLNKLKGGTK